MEAATASLGPSARVPRLALKLLTDERLARLAAAGDRGAFGVIYERHHQALYKYCRSITRNPEDAGDALQETMASALSGLEGDHREFALKPWLFRIAHNESVSLLRRRRAPAELDERTTPSVAGPEAGYAQRERLKLLLDDLSSLPYRQRGALVMRELSGLEYRRIATVFDVSDGAARQLVSEARASLHELAGGRDMRCQAVVRTIADGDGRALRGRKLRAHLRACEGCRQFARHNGRRAADLRALVPPMPTALAAAVLSGIGIGAGTAGGGGGVAALVAGGAGQVAGADIAAKGAVAAVVALAAGVGVAEHVVDHGRADRDLATHQADAREHGGGAERSATNPGERPGEGKDLAARSRRARRGDARGGGEGRGGAAPTRGGRGDGAQRTSGHGKRGDGSSPNGGGTPATQTPATQQVAQAPASSPTAGSGGGGTTTSTGSGGSGIWGPASQMYQGGMQAGAQAMQIGRQIIQQTQRTVNQILGGFQPQR